MAAAVPPRRTVPAERDRSVIGNASRAMPWHSFAAYRGSRLSDAVECGPSHQKIKPCDCSIPDDGANSLSHNAFLVLLGGTVPQAGDDVNQHGSLAIRPLSSPAPAVHRCRHGPRSFARPWARPPLTIREFDASAAASQEGMLPCRDCLRRNFASFFNTLFALLHIDAVAKSDRTREIIKNNRVSCHRNRCLRDGLANLWQRSGE